MRDIQKHPQFSWARTTDRGEGKVRTPTFGSAVSHQFGDGETECMRLAALPLVDIWLISLASMRHGPFPAIPSPNLIAAILHWRIQNGHKGWKFQTAPQVTTPCLSAVDVFRLGCGRPSPWLSKWTSDAAVTTPLKFISLVFPRNTAARLTVMPWEPLLVLASGKPANSAL
jgi:hypothetical protein